MKFLKIICIFILIIMLLNTMLPIISSATNQTTNENTITNKVKQNETQIQEKTQTSSDTNKAENDEINNSDENITLEENEKDSSNEEIFNNIKVKDLSVAYSTYIQDLEWQEAVINGDTAGTIGESKRIEAIKIKLFNAQSNAKIKYDVYIIEDDYFSHYDPIPKYLPLYYFSHLPCH